LAAKSSADVGRLSRIVITSLPSAGALTETAAALLQAGHPSQIVVETSTLPLETKEGARKTLLARDIEMLDCPISGTGAQARNKDIVVYASGSRVAYRRVARVLDGFTARTTTWVRLVTARR
jgi:3-hydroxyisobutyrate dehydrogenase-like beta-hydroxyacid dehydrogenase